MNASLDQVVAQTRALLLDFDGPVCGIFAGYPAPLIAAELVQVLRRFGIDVEQGLAAEPDPLEVLRWTGKTVRRPEVTRAVEDALCDAELRAVQTATPTPHGPEVIAAARQADVVVAIVSNNSAGSVRAYADVHDLADDVALVVGRAYAQPELMKPNPTPILDAVKALDQSPGACLLVGDSLSDIDGAKRAGVPVIGYANRPHKADLFGSAGADAVVTSMRDIAVALTSRSR